MIRQYQERTKMSDKTYHEPSEMASKSIIPEIRESDKARGPYEGELVIEDGQLVFIDAHSRVKYFVRKILDIKPIDIKPIDIKPRIYYL
ncbi:MAG: hypothetical protein ACPLXC_02135 [Candidatus Pacearchaeota archaeon]